MNFNMVAKNYIYICFIYVYKYILIYIYRPISEIDYFKDLPELMHHLQITFTSSKVISVLTDHINLLAGNLTFYSDVAVT
jgi:hypothetical protein